MRDPLTERCNCGHQQKDHETEHELIPGHGRCKKCYCPKFTWVPTPKPKK